MKKYDYLIVGAGIFGVTVANLLNNAGKKCLVIDRRNHIAGNLYTEQIEGINVHKYGAHIFHTNNKYVWAYLNKFTEFNNYINSPVASYRNEIYNLPFNMNTFAQIYGCRDPETAKKMIAADKDESVSEPSNLEEQAISLVGKKIYSKLIKGYTEKQWGRACSELPASIIKRLPLRFVYDNNYFNAKYQGIPIGGYTQMIQNMLEGIDVKLNEDYLKHKDTFDSLAETVIYTGPIDEYFDYRFGVLEYRSLRFKTEVKDVPNYQGVAVMNFTDIEPKYTRVIEHKHFESFGDTVYANPKTVVTEEYSQTWERGKHEPYYPVNDAKNTELLEKYKTAALAEKNVWFGGRLAEYKYYDIDKTVESAFSLAKELIDQN